MEEWLTEWLVKQNKYLKNTKGDQMGPNTKILSNLLRIIILRERPGPKLREIVVTKTWGTSFTIFLQQNNTYNIRRCYYKFFLKYIPPKTNIIIKIEKPNNTMFVKFLFFFCNASICRFKSATIIDSLVTEEGLET